VSIHCQSVPTRTRKHEHGFFRSVLGKKSVLC
jgi:hypothetical protein